MSDARGFCEAQAGAVLVLCLGIVTLLSFQPLRLDTRSALEIAPAPDPAGTSADPLRASELSLNRAAVSDLMRLPGIGPVIARRIVEHRGRHGAFSRIEDLRAISGIGQAKLAKIRPYLVLGEGRPSEEVEAITGVDGDDEHEGLEVAR